jgi:hypothetical protein
MVAQSVLPYQLKLDTSKTILTGLGGLALYLDLAHIVGLRDSIARHLSPMGTSQGWSVEQLLTTLILLNLAGGQCVEDLAKLEGDEGFALILHRTETFALPRAERRELELRWRKSTDRSVPSISALRRFLLLFHDPAQEELRVSGQAFIPAPNEALRSLAQINRDHLSFLQQHHPKSTATLDMDATLAETLKKEALFCYKGFRAYQPLNVWWAEQQVVVHSEFRDGNVPAGFEQLRVLQESLACLPPGVEKVAMRSDTAGYQWDLLRYCAEGKDERFGVIDFAVGADVNPAFRAAVRKVAPEAWQPLCRQQGERLVDTGQEWAEVCFVPNKSARKKDGPTYRFLAIREPLAQLELEGMESDQAALPFPTIDYPGQIGPRRFKLFGLVTNLDRAGDEVIWWLRERCGKSEEAHAVMKDDLAGGCLPSKYFGVNAAWWGAMILALNLNAIMKRLVLGAEWVTKRMKAIRYWIINVPGRVVRHARQLILRLGSSHPSTQILLDAREVLATLGTGRLAEP